jgi:hypothetical protein
VGGQGHPTKRRLPRWGGVSKPAGAESSPRSYSPTIKMRRPGFRYPLRIDGNTIPTYLALFSQVGLHPLGPWQGEQVAPLLDEPVGGSLPGGAVNPHVRHRLHPDPRLIIQVGEIGEAGSRPEVAPHVLDPALYPPLRVAAGTAPTAAPNPHPIRPAAHPSPPWLQLLPN